MADATFWQTAWLARYTLLDGFLVTTEISALAIAIGTVGGLVGGIVLSYGPIAFKVLARVYVDTLRGIPFLVLILSCYYGTAIFNIQISATAAGILALAAFCTAHITEIVRGAIASIPRGQAEAAKAIGLTPSRTFVYVIFPQAVRRMAGPWVNTAVEMVKASSLLAIIGVADLLLATQQVIARTYMVIPFYLLAWAIYVVINFSISRLGMYVERRSTHARI